MTVKAIAIKKGMNNSAVAEAVYEKQENRQIHTNIFKDRAVFTPSKENFIYIYKTYLPYGKVNIRNNYDRSIENVHTFGPVDLDNNQSIRSEEGYYVADNQCKRFPEALQLVTISVLPNDQICIFSYGNYIIIKESENATTIEDLITVSDTLPLDESEYELDENTNEYVLRGHKSKQCIKSGYHSWISKHYSLDWVYKEISFDDLYQKLYSTSESPVSIPTANTIVEQVNHIKEASEKFRELLQDTEIFFTYSPEENQCRFLIKSYDGYCLDSDYRALCLDETINRISCDDLISSIIIPKKGYILKKSDLNLSSDSPIEFRGTQENILETTNNELYEGKAVLYTEPENGEICYLVY